jgi:hypothetical protein
MWTVDYGNPGHRPACRAVHRLAEFGYARPVSRESPGYVGFGERYVKLTFAEVEPVAAPVASAAAKRVQCRRSERDDGEPTSKCLRPANFN